jgi:hypothetical protein
MKDDILNAIYDDAKNDLKRGKNAVKIERAHQ